MLKKILVLVLGCLSAVTMAGCVTAKTYVINKPRVDQEIPGMPPQESVKTRKVVVLEIIEQDKASAQSVAKVVDPVPVPAKAAGMPTTMSPEEKNFELPQSTVAETKKIQEQSSVAPQEYVVEKDDTLQKISKKVYGSYSKWTKIYDANRDILKDPNFLKSGIKIKIPALESPVSPEANSVTK